MCGQVPHALLSAAHTSGMTTWLTSDTHWSHRNIITLGPGRPFSSIEEHDEALIEAWNAVVRPDDTVIHLGDVSLSVTAMERVLPRLRGRKELYAGNHDGCWTATPSTSGARRAPNLVRRYLAAGFDRVHHTGQGFGSVAGIPVMFAHLPSHGDHYTDERYPDQRPTPGSLPLVCGHVHHAWTTHGRQVNVGVDRWGYAPVHEDAVATLLRALPEG